ncbi:hypothetical protein Sjap_024298 [Stephania japonica]|uniref:Uncharacterized protein n=1 Tax=Stephania japonica TaxID=461633 RepID=A0AAP0ED59_9MAGN
MHATSHRRQLLSPDRKSCFEIRIVDALLAKLFPNGLVTDELRSIHMIKRVGRCDAIEQVEGAKEASPRPGRPMRMYFL